MWGLKSPEKARMMLGLILREIMCEVNEFSLRLLTHRMALCSFSLWMPLLLWVSSRNYKKNRYEPLPSQRSFLYSCLRILDRSPYRGEGPKRSQGERLWRQMDLKWNPGSSLTAYIGAGQIPEPCHSPEPHLWSQVDANFYLVGFLWEWNEVKPN